MKRKIIFTIMLLFVLFFTTNILLSSSGKSLTPCFDKCEKIRKESIQYCLDTEALPFRCINNAKADYKQCLTKCSK
jgi:hypothetical protein